MYVWTQLDQVFFIMYFLQTKTPLAHRGCQVEPTCQTYFLPQLPCSSTRLEPGWRWAAVGVARRHGRQHRQHPIHPILQCIIQPRQVACYPWRVLQRADQPHPPPNTLVLLVCPGGTHDLHRQTIYNSQIWTLTLFSLLEFGLGSELMLRRCGAGPCTTARGTCCHSVACPCLGYWLGAFALGWVREANHVGVAGGPLMQPKSLDLCRCCHLIATRHCPAVGLVELEEQLGNKISLIGGSHLSAYKG